MKIKGTFSVGMTPTDAALEMSAPAQFSQLRLNKTFQGDLSATSSGQMMSVRLENSASAGYVALEQVIGTLSGKSGSFILQHFGIMTESESRLILEVVPNSGTEELSQLTGSMSITLDQGQHFYEFDYEC